MCNPFGGGGGGGQSSQTSSQTTTNTSVATTSNVTVDNTVDTADIADAIKALAAGGMVNAQTSAAAQVVSAKYAAAGQLGAAQIAAGAGPSWETIITIGAALFGLAITFHLIKVRGFK